MAEKKIPVERYTRVVGYYRPVDQFNPGKQSEESERVLYNVNKAMGKLREKK